MLRVRLMGAVGAEADGQSLNLGQLRQRATFAWLALVHPRASSVDSIVQALWGDDSPASARNAVQVYVSGLRKVLRGHGVDLERVGDGYALRGRDLWVDVTTFEDLVSRGRTGFRTGDGEQAVSSLEEAVDLWADPPLDGLGDLEFIAAARTDLRETLVAALVDLARGSLELSRPDDGVRAARRLLSVSPYDERGWAALATAHYVAGRQDEALTACRQARQVLLDELGVDPSPELAGLEVKILNHQVELGHAPSSPEESRSAGVAATPPRPPDPFVGREGLVDEITTLTTQGSGLVTLAGMGGIGKTSLAAATGRRLLDAGHRVAFVGLDHDQTCEAALERMCRTLGLDPSDTPLDVLTRRSRELVDVLVLDNVEQIDGFSTAVGELHRSGNAPTLIVTSRLPLRVRGEQVVTVPPLPTDPDGDGGSPSPAVDLFVANAQRAKRDLDARSILGDAAVLCELLGGIPLAIELAAARSRILTPAQMVARLTHSTSALDGTRSTDRPDRQASLTRVLDTTHDMLEKDSRSLLGLLCEIDGRVSVDFIEPAVNLEQAAFLDALDDLVSCGLVSSQDGWLSLATPVREFGRSRPGRQRRARALIDQAVRYAADGPADIGGSNAGAEVARLSAADDALTSALTRACETKRPEEAAVLVLRLHRMWLLTGRIVEARRWIEQVRAMDDHTVANRVRLELLTGTFASYLNDTSAITTLQTALADAEAVELPADRVLVNAWCCLAALFAHHSQIPDAQQAVHRAAAAAAESHSPILVSLARDIGAQVAAYAGDFESALEASLAGVADARRVGDEYDLILMLYQAGNDLTQLGRFDEALILADEAFDRADRLPVGPVIGAVLLQRGFAHAAAGSLSVATTDLTAALRVTAEQYPDPLASADSLYLLAYCAGVAGRYDESARYYGAAEAMYEDEGVEPGKRTGIVGAAERTAVRDAMGASRFDTFNALGRAEPVQVMESLTRTT